jgi:hypothetical protein
MRLHLADDAAAHSHLILSGVLVAHVARVVRVVHVVHRRGYIAGARLTAVGEEGVHSTVTRAVLRVPIDDLVYVVERSERSDRERSGAGVDVAGLGACRDTLLRTRPFAVRTARRSRVVFASVVFQLLRAHRASGGHLQPDVHMPASDSLKDLRPRPCPPRQALADWKMLDAPPPHRHSDAMFLVLDADARMYAVRTNRLLALAARCLAAL